jgi:hypothetical protein
VHLVVFPPRAAQCLGGDQRHERGLAMNDDAFAVMTSDADFPVAYVKADA